MGKVPVYVFQHNHFDPFWQRCWNRSFDWKGKRYRSYAEAEEFVFDFWLENAKSGMTFNEGQSAVIRKYLERNPDRVDEFKRLVQNGQIELMAAGEIVCDLNMPSGETVLRNLILGQRYFEDTFGVIPGIASLEDAFGHSGNIPQMLRGIECKMAQYLSRIRVPGDYWRGIDGSTVFIGRAPAARHVGHWQKISPCPACDGMGCDDCEGRGLAQVARIADEHIWQELTADYGDVPFGVLGIGGEEAVPNTNLPDIIERARQELGLDIRTGAMAQLAAYYADAVERVDDPDIDVSDQVEANCIYTGCYVSRIRTKQELRRLENLVNTAERWATVAYLLGTDYPSDDLLEAWRTTVFLAFHDAVTGTHNDQPYIELLDMIAEADCTVEHVLDQALTDIEDQIALDQDKQYLVVYNSDSWERNDPVTVTADTSGLPRLVSPSGAEIDVLDASAIGADVTFTFRTPVPPLGYTVVEVVPDTSPIDSGITTAGPGEVENEFFKVSVGEKGIESILDKRNGRVISGDTYLINELLLEEDKGDPWGTTEIPPPPERLSPYTTSVGIRRAANVSEILITGQYKGSDPAVKILSWRQSMILYKGSDRIDFRTEIDWDTENRRIRVAFPTGIQTDEAVYSIPYGALKRGTYEPELIIDRGTNGDWPAVNWIDVFDGEEDFGVALLNLGTPSHKVKDGVILLSILRSPADIWSVTEEDYDNCLDFDGVRDAGSHEFHYSLLPHQGDFASAGLEKRGREFNNPLICRGLSGSGDSRFGLSHSFLKLEATGNVVVAAIKKADRDDSVVVRLAETNGETGEAAVSLDGAGHNKSLVNFLERHPQPVSGKIQMTPFKMITLQLERIMNDS